MKRWQSCLTAIALGLAATPVAFGQTVEARKIVAMLDGTQNFGTTQRALNFYDVTDLSGSSVFGQTPLFSVWTGYEDTVGANYEDVSTFTVNPVNGSIYLVAFDSGTPGATDGAGDTEGDYDLYRIDYQEILNDFITNGRAAGTMYAPTTTTDGFGAIDHPSHNGTTQHITGAITKVGEIARTQDPGFFDPDVEFVRPDQLVLMDNAEDLSGTIPTDDFQLRMIQRVATTSGSATTFGTNEGGFNNQTAESWESNTGSTLDMDGGFSFSNPEDMVFVERDGVMGVWVADSDGGGDDVSFFELDFGAMTATKKEIKAGPSPYPTGFALDEDPTVDPTTNDGDHDFLLIDASGNLVIGESGFFDSPQTEPKIITREILNYDGADSDANTFNEVVPGGWTTSANLPLPTSDDDSSVTDGRFATIDKSTGYIYFFDIDSGSPPNVVSDVYVFDPVTGSFVYEEQNAANHFTIEHGIRLFVRGDTDGNHIVNADDIDRFFDGVTDPTFGGTVTSDIGQEWYDLTGELLLDTTDVDELVEEILGTAYGDADLDGDVDSDDFNLLAFNFGQAGGWAAGDFDGSDVIDSDDFNLLAFNFGFGTLPDELDAIDYAALDEFRATFIPEPSSLVLLGVSGLAMLRRRKRC